MGHIKLKLYKQKMWFWWWKEAFPSGNFIHISCTKQFHWNDIDQFRTYKFGFKSSQKQWNPTRKFAWTYYTSYLTIPYTCVTYDIFQKNIAIKENVLIKMHIYSPVCEAGKWSLRLAHANPLMAFSDHDWLRCTSWSPPRHTTPLIFN